MLLHNWIDGQARTAESGDRLLHWNPALGQKKGELPDSDEQDVAVAVAAARTAAPTWAALSPEERAACLYRLAELVEASASELARLETLDTGKPLALAARMDIPRASANLRFFAAAATQFASEAHPVQGKAINYTLRMPHGVVGCISPWNLPLYLFTWKIAPALAAGNAVVAKPSEVTPTTAAWLAQASAAAGFPPGVFNVVHGLGTKVGAALVAHPDVKAISFTGGTATGRNIQQIAGAQFKKLSLELGGKNPALIFEGTDLEAVVPEIVRSSFTNQGQICLCTSRIYVQASIYEDFRSRFVQAVEALTIGDPFDLATQQGALTSRVQYDKVLAALTTAHAEGGSCLTGGEPFVPSGKLARGWFVRPTVFENLSPESQTNQQEIFGPVVTLAPFDTPDHAVALANSTAYGLASVVWCPDIRTVLRVSEQLQSGIIWVNTWLNRDLRTPFGGMHQSGLGREGGLEAMRFFTEPRNVCLAH
jgi:aminomuconate-semialdehyde/2-hydroxymuconate-6-semialdehyde dehydrogenase